MTEIAVTGSAQIAAATDLAILNLSSEATAPSASEALELVAQRAVAVQEALDEVGIERADRGAQHSHVNRHSRWDGEVEVQLGWRAHISMECVVRDPATAFGVLEAIAALPDINANGPHWKVAPDNPAHRQARHLAIDHARRKATDYADALGVSLGPVLRVDDGHVGVDPSPRRMHAASMESVDAATQHVSATVTVTYGTV